MASYIDQVLIQGEHLVCRARIGVIPLILLAARAPVLATSIAAGGTWWNSSGATKSASARVNAFSYGPSGARQFADFLNLATTGPARLARDFTFGRMTGAQRPRSDSCFHSGVSCRFSFVMK